MNTFRILAATLLTTILVGSLPPGQGGAAEATPATNTVELAKTVVEPPAQLTLVNATPEQTETVAEAMATFDAANLELPPLQIEFHEDEQGCKGYSGLYLPTTATRPAPTDRIEICSRLKIILLHELAHAWKQHNLDDETKAAFTAHWGLENWNDKADAHDDRGVERAAHTIAFTLNQVDANANDAIVDYVCDYELLTGMTLDIHTKIAC